MISNVHSKYDKKLISRIDPKTNHKKTIVITDSGLGGLSTTANLAKRISKQSPTQELEIIYFNALAENNFGYNNLKSVSEKVSVFSTALESMQSNHKPDFILVACNTLSVIYDKTDFAKNTSTKVVSIVDVSMKLMLDFFKTHIDGTLIIFGTNTTIQSSIYQSLLLKNGIKNQNIISIPGNDLHLEIEKNPNSLKAKKIINMMVKEAISKIKNKTNTPLAVSLNCTHYGYSKALFESAFKEQNHPLTALINPNTAMNDFFFENEIVTNNPKISFLVTSQASIDKNKIETMSRLLKDESPQLIEALNSYNLNPNLFEWKSLINHE